MSIRPVKSIVTSKPTMEGAGVKLRRAFGFGDTSVLPNAKVYAYSARAVRGGR